jgi:hypothetical protein
MIRFTRRGQRIAKLLTVAWMEKFLFATFVHQEDQVYHHNQSPEPYEKNINPKKLGRFHITQSLHPGHTFWTIISFNAGRFVSPDPDAVVRDGQTSRESLQPEEYRSFTIVRSHHRRRESRRRLGMYQLPQQMSSVIRRRLRQTPA